ncbi:Zinc knuckle family protein isoform 2 [Theobroma cacao]|uniref:Zinc knuckle family protein isoform 2 n=1 Tax=Theobroma cacao TaxID=3641 RepID=A0A061DR91_THECC|nr:Zinc knuckle family protein isoform 2 [Theobroma cacao]
MANRADPDIDDDFSEIYKEYTGPPGSTVSKAQDKVKENKRSHAGSDEEEEQRDPNAVPTDFTSREAKVWEAKSKATERNWKKRKEEEMICKICGESGHFTQGCPSTLGANRKSQDFFERVPAREPHVRALFTEKVIQRIEKDIGCKIKMDEKFIIVSGKDRLILKKGVDAVHKVKDEGDQRGSSSSHRSRSRSPERSPVGARLRRPESQRAHSGPHNSSHFQQRLGRQDKTVEDRVREDLRKFSRGSPQGRDSIRYVYGIHRKLQELMVMMELGVARAILNLQAVYLMLATHIIPMRVIIKTWGLIELMHGILRDGDLICNLAISLNTLPSLKR